MIVDELGMRPSPSKMNAIANVPVPIKIEELCSFLGLTGYIRNFVARYSNLLAPLANFLRNKAFGARRLLIQ